MAYLYLSSPLVSFLLLCFYMQCPDTVVGLRLPQATEQTTCWRSVTVMLRTPKGWRFSKTEILPSACTSEYNQLAQGSMHVT